MALFVAAKGRSSSMTVYEQPPTTSSGRKDLATRFRSGAQHPRWKGLSAPVPAGHRFGFWEVLDPSFIGPVTHRQLLCRCTACGKERAVDWHSLRSGRTSGCLCQSRSKNSYPEPWMRKVAKSIVAARNRCRNPRNPHWPDYGGRGITFDFSSTRAAVDWIVQYLGERPTGHSLDRIDNNKGYAPGNLRWQDDDGQKRNRRVTKIKEPIDWDSPYVETVTRKLLRQGLTKDEIFVRARLAVQEKRKGWRVIEKKLVSMTS